MKKKGPKGNLFTVSVMVENRVFESLDVNDQRFGRAVQRTGQPEKDTSTQGKRAKKKTARPELTQFGIRNVLFGITYFA